MVPDGKVVDKKKQIISVDKVREIFTKGWRQRGSSGPWPCGSLAPVPGLQSCSLSRAVLGGGHGPVVAAVTSPNHWFLDSPLVMIPEEPGSRVAKLRGS